MDNVQSLLRLSGLQYYQNNVFLNTSPLSMKKRRTKIVSLQPNHLQSIQESVKRTSKAIPIENLHKHVPSAPPTSVSWK
jgi:hypothetical protein